MENTNEDGAVEVTYQLQWNAPKGQEDIKKYLVTSVGTELIPVDPENPEVYEKSVAAEVADKLVVLNRAEWADLVPDPVKEGFTYTITVKAKTDQCKEGGVAAAITYREPFRDQLDNTELDLLQYAFLTIGITVYVWSAGKVLYYWNSAAKKPENEEA